MKVMNLVSRSNNFYEKRAIEAEYAVMCSTMHKVFLRMCMCINTHTHIL